MGVIVRREQLLGRWVLVGRLLTIMAHALLSASSSCDVVKTVLSFVIHQVLTLLL